MKLTNYSTISEQVEVSLASIRAKEMAKGSSNTDAAYYTIGVLKSLLCESLLDVPAKTQAHVLDIIKNMAK